MVAFEISSYGSDTDTKGIVERKAILDIQLKSFNKDKDVDLAKEHESLGIRSKESLDNFCVHWLLFKRMHQH